MAKRNDLALTDKGMAALAAAEKAETDAKAAAKEAAKAAAEAFGLPRR